MTAAGPIRPATARDIPNLAAIERAAARRFTLAGIHLPDPAATLPIDRLHAAHAAGILWVACDSTDSAVGFLCACPLEDAPSALFIEEISVDPDHQSRGLGGALVQAAQAAAGMLWLTTFAAVSWNAPWYARHGFAVQAPMLCPPSIQLRLAREADAGLSDRCAMRWQRVW